MRLLIIQYAGDYREVFYRFASGQGETYYAQKYSVEAVANLCQYGEVATLCCLTDERYNEVLPNGVRAIGMGMQGQVNFKAVLEDVKAYAPTHIILRTPASIILKWINRHKIPTLLTLADSFVAKGPRGQLNNFLLANQLNHPCIQWVGNHGVTASKALEAIGVNAKKIIPWDWPHSITPDAYPAKTLAMDAATREILYIGALTQPKGVDDLIDAIALLHTQGMAVKLKLAGKGETDRLQAKINALGITKQVEFLGLVEHRLVVDLMRSADVVVVPSRHEFPEGFPMTLYEALCSRTPIVASDHPMFLHHLQHSTSAMVFPAGRSSDLATCVASLLTNPELYQRLSQTSYATWRQLQVPVKWADLISRWVNDSSDNQAWLSQYSLASGIYDLDTPVDISSVVPA